MNSTTQMTMLNVKINSDLKREAQKLARDFGISVSSMVNNALRNIVQEKRVEFTKPLVPNAKTAKILDKAIADIKAGKNLSPEFTNMDDAVAWLEK